MDVASRHPAVSLLPALAGCLSAGRAAVRCVAVLVVTPWVLGAQNVAREAVGAAHDTYQEAYQAYQDTLSTLNGLEGRWASLIDQLDQARERGDEAAMNRLRPDFQELSEQKEAAEARSRRAEAVWREAGRILIQRIGAFQQILSEQLLAADEDTQVALLSDFDEMGRLRVEVEEDMGPRELGFPVAPNIQELPEDTPVDRLRKAASWDEYAGKLDRFREELETEILRLERDQQIEAQMSAFGRDPLGMRDVPVRTGGAGGGRAGADTTEVDLTQPTLAQEIDQLRRMQDQVVEEMKRVQEQAAELRGRPGGNP